MSGTKKKPSKKTICIIVAIVLLLGIIGSCNDSLKDKQRTRNYNIKHYSCYNNIKANNSNNSNNNRSNDRADNRGRD